MRYLVMYEVCNDVGGIQHLLRWLKLVDYIHVQVDKLLYNYQIANDLGQVVRIVD